MFVVISSGYPLLVFANSSDQQTATTTQQCPTYQVNLVVDYVNSNPINPVLGTNVTTRVHVVYQDGTPVTLSPQTISFLWTGSNGQKEYDNVPVVYTGSPGFYNYTQTITSDLLQATGQGKVTVWVILCSCSDVRGNRGPVSNVNSDLTLTPSDNSNLNIGVPPSPNQFAQLASLAIPILVILLLILALILFLRRRKPTTSAT
jgi:hypothetical protein